jgi:tetratricopeptide (TPR) repeat protein
VLLLAAAPLAAQQGGAPGRAFELERKGNYAQAAEAYRTVLAASPGDVQALFGLERTLVAMNRLGDILPQARAAVAANPRHGPAFGILLRAWSAQGEPDSVRAAAERWAAVAPGDETPYREWGLAALARRDAGEARRAFLTGRERLGQPEALAAELAQAAVQQQDWPLALKEWLAAIARVPGYRASAVGTLGAAPQAARA